MERNYEQEMDALREQMETLQQTVFSQLNALQAAVAELLPGKPSSEQGEHVSCDEKHAPGQPPECTDGGTVRENRAAKRERPRLLPRRVSVRRAAS